MKVTNTIGPFAATMTNVNTQMKLPGHSHFVKVYLTFTAAPNGDDPRAFPAFMSTTDEVHAAVSAYFKRPLRNATNEIAALGLFNLFAHWSTTETERWGGKYKLTRVDLDVRGVPDDIGHSDGYTRYTVGP
jgi:hypothetical protein